MNPATGLEILMKRLLDSGHPDETVAKALEVSVSMVAQYRKRWGLPVCGKQTRTNRPVRTQRTIDAANDMRYGGAKTEIIAKRLGISRRSVYRMLRPELKTGSKTYSAATRQRLSKYMRDNVQPLGAAQTKKYGRGFRYGKAEG